MQRHLYMMTSRTLLHIGIGLFILGIAWFIFSTGEQEPYEVFSATINRDCAPWDGSAFTVSIPLLAGESLRISIYQSPDILLPVTFSLPDETMMVGNALLLLPVGVPDELSGKVSFQRVEQGILTEGRFDLLTETGRQFKGNFKAEWEHQPVYCG